MKFNHLKFKVFAGVLIVGAMFAVVWVGSIGVAEADSQSTVSITAPEKINPDENFEITINTQASAGTVVEVNPGSGDVSISSDSAVKITDNRIEFLDPNLGSSQYTIQVNYNTDTPSGSIDISSWVNSEKQASADDTATEKISVMKGVKIIDPTIKPKSVNSDGQSVHNLSFNVAGVSADGANDTISIDIPSNVTVIDASNPRSPDSGYDIDIKKKANPVKLVTDPTASSDTVSFEIKVTLRLKTIKS